MRLDLDRARQGGAWIAQELDPRIKVVVALLFILAVSLTPFGAFAPYALLLALVWAAAAAAGVEPGYLLKRSFIAVPFALAAVTLPFTVPGETVAVIPAFGGLAVSAEGLVRFASILVRSWISVQMAILLMAVTSFPALLAALTALRVPRPLIAIISFMYRYLFVLSEEALRLRRARAARSGARPGLRSGGTLLWRGKVAGQMVGSLMLRSLERSERIYNAMLARGYAGQVHTPEPMALTARDLAVLAGAVAVLTAVLLWAY